VYIRPLPPLDIVRELLAYDSTTGIFRWRVDRGGSVKAGDVAGGDCEGYRVIAINDGDYHTSRLAWLLHYGVDPLPLQIDHIDRNPGNDRIANLRAVTHFENGQNRADGASGVVGVWYDKQSRRWFARVPIGGRKHIYGPNRKYANEAAEDREWMWVRKVYPDIDV
jgi:hypothetical protein